MNRAALLLLAAATVLCAGCLNDHHPPGVEGTGAQVPLLMIGNSHTSFNNLPGMLEEMVRTAHPAESVDAIVAPGWMFLDERISDQPSLALLRGQDWSYVVLQAQRYFLVTRPQPPTTDAEAFVRMARERHAVPILFPEWPRLGIDETMIIYDIMVSIAQKEPACVAPVGQAFDLSMSRHPGIGLHASDGNHSNSAGALLAALVLFATVTGVTPLDAPNVSGPVSNADQALLRQVAEDTVQAWPPRAWCPDDPY